MKKKTGPARALCEQHCSYYKPGKNETMACEGFAVVRRLIEQGRDLPLGRRAPGSESTGSQSALRKTLCARCGFREADCDFILTGGKALPCGGFVVLRHLLDEGKVAIEEIEEP